MLTLVNRGGLFRGILGVLHDFVKFWNDLSLDMLDLRLNFSLALCKLLAAHSLSQVLHVLLHIISQLKNSNLKPFLVNPLIRVVTVSEVVLRVRFEI